MVGEVHFFWDRYDNKDENSSCRVRVSKPWAGDKWGFISRVSVRRSSSTSSVAIPTADDHRRVYNADQMPLGLPEKTKRPAASSRAFDQGGGPTDFNGSA